MPLVGKELPGNETLKLVFNLLAASAPFTEQDVKTLNSLLPQGATPIPELNLAKGILLSTPMKFGDICEFLSLPITTNPSTGQPAPKTTGASSPIKWFSVQKSFGPAFVNRVGVEYHDAKLYFFLDTSLTMDVLTLSLIDLSIDAPLGLPLAPHFGLQGLGIDYKSGPLEIGGAFLKQDPLPAGTEFEFSGTATIKTSKLCLSAIGSYAQMNDGDPSLFVYANLDEPLGGPAFFFVTGVAAGFGYNRELIVPGVAEVAQFPLVAEVLSGQGPSSVGANTVLADELSALDRYIPPAVGDYFFVAGIKFTTFEIINSFALLAVSFENPFEVRVLGVSTLIVPTPVDGQVSGGATPLAEVQVEFLAGFVPADGFLGIDAQLTPSSFILSRDCHLTGGYAFYSWFSGEHEGEFVQTLGGYHPDFRAPAYYPHVPRLAINWPIDPFLSITGNAYYALTGSMLMAGGALDAVWACGNLRAWFTLGADFLMTWKPYHYDAQVSVTMGVSYTFRIHIKFIGTIHKTISVDVGADMHIWGTDFAGVAHVHLSIVSFSVAFGSGSSALPPPIAWSEFQSSFLPQPDAVCSIAVSGGLMKTVTGASGNDYWIINPKDFSLVTNSVIPSKTAVEGSSGAAIDTGEANTMFGIGSMGITDAVGALTSKHTITIEKMPETTNEKPAPAEKDFAYTPVLKNVPYGLWGPAAVANEVLPAGLNAPSLIRNTLAGFTLTPKQEPSPGKTADINIQNLRYAPNPVPNAFHWEPPIPAFFGQDTGEKNESKRRTLIGQNLAGNTARAELISALGMNPECVDISFSAAQALSREFLIAPQVAK